MIQSNDESLNIIQEDRDHFDYILSIEKLRFHDGVQRPLSTRRLMIEKLKKNNKIVVRPIDIQNQSIQQQIRSVFDEWEVERGSSPETTEKLKFAIERLFEMNTCQQIRSFGAYTEDQLVGYSINELTHTEYAVGHFQQANLKIDKQIYALLMQETATSLGEEGCKYINIEQDLGIDGLRKWKTSYQPVFFLKKYKITPKSLVD